MSFCAFTDVGVDEGHRPTVKCLIVMEVSCVEAEAGDVRAPSLVVAKSGD